MIALAVGVYVIGWIVSARKTTRWLCGDIPPHDFTDYAACGALGVIAASLWPVAVIGAPFVLLLAAFAKAVSR